MHYVTQRMCATPGGFKRPAPRIGQHSRELLQPLVGAAEYDALVARGAIVEDSLPASPREPVADLSAV